MDNIIWCGCCNKPILDLFYEKHQQYCLAMPHIIEG